jgi:hypothetical protein
MRGTEWRDWAQALWVEFLGLAAKGRVPGQMGWHSLGRDALVSGGRNQGVSDSTLHWAVVERHAVNHDNHAMPLITIITPRPIKSRMVSTTSM